MATNPTDPFDSVSIIYHCPDCDGVYNQKNCPVDARICEPKASIPALRRAVVGWLRGEARNARDMESTSSDARTYDRLAIQLERGGE